MPNDRDRPSRQLSWALNELDKCVSTSGRQAADPSVALPGLKRSLATPPEILFGRVVDAIPYVGTYKVLPERGMNALTCCYMAPGPNAAFGVRSVSTIPPGAQVWFIYHRDSNYGVILGVEPQFMTRATAALSDYIYVGSRTGLHRDTASSYPFTLNTRGIGDWSARTPFDSTNAGEWGGITETGLRVLLDSAMVQVGVGESCGLYCFLWDQMCRLAGVNLQIRSSAFERESLDDEGEHSDIEYGYVYPWEGLGAAEPGGAAGRELGPEETQISAPWYGAYEPQYDDQMGIARRMDFGGYLGQGGKRIIQTPVGGGVWRYSQPGQAATVFEENISLSGSYTMRASKRVLLARRPLIPQMTPQKRPEDAEGDTPENYKASGQYGSGEDHKIEGEPRVDTGELTQPDKMMLRALGIQDLMAYAFNWEATHAAHYHGKDWLVAEETASEIGSEIEPPSLRVLAEHGKQYLSDAKEGSVNIDHRYQSVQYALATSYVSLSDDGGVVIGDGFGSEIRMAGGHIFLTAPGDVWHKAGRNVVSWGGRDVLIRGRNHVDITATRQDVRIKAEQHLWALAGNGEANGMLLLESRCSLDDYVFQDEDGQPRIGEDAVAGGIALRTEGGNIVNWGKNIYMRTGGGDVLDGNITLDASAGRMGVYTNTSFVLNFLNADSAAARYDAYYSGKKVNTAHEWRETNMFYDGNVQFLGYGAFDGVLLTNDTIYVNHGHIWTADAPDYNMLVAALEPGWYDGWYDGLQERATTLQEDLSIEFETNFEKGWHSKYKAGYEDTLKFAEFSFRTSELQYNTYAPGSNQFINTDPDSSEGGGGGGGGPVMFSLYEDRWQQMARLGSGGGVTWDEKFVTTQGLRTAPYPGTEAMEHPQSYVEMDTTMFDHQTGTSKSRGEPGKVADEYADPTYGKPQPKVLDGTYLVIG